MESVKAKDRLKQGFLLLDGAMGTMIQGLDLPAAAWGGKPGCNEWLNLSAPEAVEGIHRGYLRAGCGAVETNTFGASRLTLREHGLARQAGRINRAAAGLARAAADSAGRPVLVFGAIGPGSLLPTLGRVAFAELRDACREQVEALLEGGVDGILFETCQDILQVKAGLLAVREVAGDDPEFPVYVSVTVEPSGRLLIGSTLTAVVAALRPFSVSMLGLNCATGPEKMRRHLNLLREIWPGPIAVMPNAGMPVLEEGRVRYPLPPGEFARRTAELVRECSLSAAGGCCGSTPEHLRALRAELKGYRPSPRRVEPVDRVASVYFPVELDQSPPPLYVGERANATGSRRFRQALLAGDRDAVLAILAEQEEAGSHLLDLSCAWAGRDEKKDYADLVPLAARQCRAPLMIDSTDPEAIETALQNYGGRAIVNSVNFEKGEEHALKVARLARRYGAALVCLTIDEEGMALTAARKTAVALRLAEFCRTRAGFGPGDLLIDPLTFTVASGDRDARTAARETVAALRAIKRKIPGVRTILGISNVSYGLKPAARRVLNSVFLDHCLRAGLDAALVHVSALTATAELDPEQVRAAERLLFDDRSAGDPLSGFLSHFEGEGSVSRRAPALPADPAEALTFAVVRGRAGPLAEAIASLLEKTPAEEILNSILVPAMKEVGRLFNEGSLQLPFVLKSAEVMKRAVDILKPSLSPEAASRRRVKLVLATVSGDVHDIGKNLVDIICANNGFEVINLGVKVPVEKMIEELKGRGADFLGMSGLIVRSAAVMAENLKAMAAEGLRVPVLLGGAALTEEFVEKECRPHYPGPVYYCADAFAGLSRLREYEETGETAALPRKSPRRPAAARRSARDAAVPPPPEIPSPPFRGARVAEPPGWPELYSFLNRRALYRTRWGLKAGGRLPAEDDSGEGIAPAELFDRMRRRVEEEALFTPGIVYGWFRCRSRGDSLLIDPGGGEEEIEWVFPRRSRPPRLCVADFFQPDGDLAGLLAVTLGDGLKTLQKSAMESGRYREVYLWHGFAAALVEALAEYQHAVMRVELGLAETVAPLFRTPVALRRGARFGFGYSCCPDLKMNADACRLLEAGRIGVSLTESDMMVPEMSTAALVSHHPAARQFAV